METNNPLLNPELLCRLGDLLLYESSQNLTAMRDSLRTMQSGLGTMIQQNPGTYSVLQDFIIDLETAEEAIEDAIAGMTSFGNVVQDGTSEQESCRSFRLSAPAFGLSFQSNRKGE